LKRIFSGHAEAVLHFGALGVGLGFGEVDASPPALPFLTVITTSLLS
jgi:hypothetical protein